MARRPANCRSVWCDPRLDGASLTAGPTASFLLSLRMSRKNLIIDDDALPVMVPRNHAPLVEVPSERVRKLSEHLDQELADLRRAKQRERPGSSETHEPTGFAARVVQTACTLCKGVCCRNGGDHAFLGE